MKMRTREEDEDEDEHDDVRKGGCADEDEVEDEDECLGERDVQVASKGLAAGHVLVAQHLVGEAERREEEEKEGEGEGGHASRDRRRESGMITTVLNRGWCEARNEANVRRIANTLMRRPVFPNAGQPTQRLLANQTGQHSTSPFRAL